MLPVISVNSKSDGLLLVNGAVAGDVGLNEWINLPVTPHGRCYVHYLSARPQTAPCGFRLDFDNGELLPPGPGFPGEITLWPTGIFEITIIPWEIPRVAPAPLVPETISRLNLPQGTASLLQYGSLWSVYEDAEGRVLLSSPLPDEAAQGSLAPLEEGFAALGKCADGREWCAAYTFGEDGWAQRLYASGDRVQSQNETLVTTQALNDWAGHQLETRWTPAPGKWQSSRTITAHQAPAQDGESLAAAFLQACALGEYREAWGYLSSGLRSQLSEVQLQGFVGQVDSYSAARYCPPASQNETALAALSRESETVLRAKPMYFTVLREGGGLRIDDIRPL